MASKLVEPGDIMLVDPIININTIELLQKKLEGVRDKHDLKELVSILEHMPLAIV